MTLAARLVRQTGAALLVLFAERRSRGRGYVVRVLPMDPPLPAADAGDQADALLINRAMEAVIRRCPAQYLWGYHRYKLPRGVQA
jgi:KDO2-lipid IV(A) lauroyltransferase